MSCFDVLFGSEIEVAGKGGQLWPTLHPPPSDYASDQGDLLNRKLFKKKSGISFIHTYFFGRGEMGWKNHIKIIYQKAFKKD